jgi:TDG/mug DNA glycosylase family protein
MVDCYYCVEEFGVRRMAVLPDVLAPDLRVVFCGTAAGFTSAAAGTYYAGAGNRLWEVLHRVGLIPRLLSPQEYATLPEYGLGLTDLVKQAAGPDESLVDSDYDVAAFEAKVLLFRPQAVAFSGLRASRAYFGRRATYGRQPERIGSSAVFVLPSTSGAARRYWRELPWQELVAWLRSDLPR